MITDVDTTEAFGPVLRLLGLWQADIDSEPFAHDNQWVGDQTPEVPR